MSNEPLEHILSNPSVPPYDEAAKQRAIQLALAEFDAAQVQRPDIPLKKSQGLFRRLRPNDEAFHHKRSKTMKQTWIYGGLASAAVTVIAILIVAPQNQQLGSTLQLTDASSVIDDLISPEPSPAVRPKPQASARSNATRMRSMESDQATAGDRVAALEEKAFVQPPVKSEGRRLLKQAEQAPTNKPDRAISIPKLATKPISPPLPAAPLPPHELSMPQAEGLGRVAPESVLSTQMGRSLDSSAFVARKKSIPMLSPATPASLTDAITAAPAYQAEGRDRFKHIEASPIKRVSETPVSTFSIDVDTASYSFVRKSLNAGRLPPKDAVRTEELLNYFDYAWPAPDDRATPFRSTIAITPSPWTAGNQLIHIGIKGYDLQATETPRSNLVFLLDVSGSMNAPDKLPLVKNALRMLLDTLKPDDTVAIAVYAGAAGTVLEPTPVKQKAKILAALARLSAGGATAGAQGIQLAYQLAQTNFDKTAVNRILLATDGDFNVGITNTEELKGFVERKRKSGVYLSILGFGRGNWNDQLTQALAQNGNGVAAYIDTLSEARKVLVEEATSTLFPIARDVKIQVEFNPERVSEYRLIGYETRALKREDFNNDAVDAGDIGSGHSLTAIYEITPKGAPGQTIDDNRYQSSDSPANTTQTDFNNEYALLKIRYKQPDSDTSKRMTTAITTAQEVISDTVLHEVRWATAVAGFAQLLKGSPYTRKLDYDAVIARAQTSKGEDLFGYRAEFINLVRLAKSARGL